MDRLEFQEQGNPLEISVCFWKRGIRGKNDILIPETVIEEQLGTFTIYLAKLGDEENAGISKEVAERIRFKNGGFQGNTPDINELQRSVTGKR